MYFRGRLNRRNFLFGAITISIISSLVAKLDPRATMGIFELLAGIFSVFFGFSIAVRRLHDINQSGWWSLVALIPVVNFFFVLYLLFVEGTGKNKFGPSPKQNIRYPHDIFLLK
jgi:uncharacterized membrane protein YhaH (DUF805 family)